MFDILPEVLYCVFSAQTFAGMIRNGHIYRFSDMSYISFLWKKVKISLTEFWKPAILQRNNTLDFFKPVNCAEHAEHAVTLYGYLNISKSSILFAEYIYLELVCEIAYVIGFW